MLIRLFVTLPDILELNYCEKLIISFDIPIHQMRFLKISGTPFKKRKFGVA